MYTQITSPRIFILLLISFSLLMAGCGTTDSDTDPDPEDPDDEPQTESFSSGDVDSDETYTYTFENEGDFDYYCNYHLPDMQGEVIVNSEVDPVERDTVIMEAMSFNPSTLEIAPNTEVVWINESSEVHTVTSGSPSSGNGGGDY